MSSRRRTPTINIDTSAVGAPDTKSEIPLQPYTDETKSSPEGFLSVPNTSQQRAGSFESGSSDTYINVPRASGDSTSELLPSGNALEPDLPLVGR